MRQDPPTTVRSPIRIKGYAPPSGTREPSRPPEQADQSGAGPVAGKASDALAVTDLASLSSNDVKFPLCDAAVRKRDESGWDLADAILAECSQTGDDGVRNESYAALEAMRKEIATNQGVELSFERIRKLRKVASAFPAGRRRPAVSLEAHLEAGTPEALETLIKDAPNGTPLTREYIRRLKVPADKKKQDQQKAERQRQTEEKRTALQNVCRQLERERDEREHRYTALCREVGKKPEPFSPPLSPKDEPPLTAAENLQQAVRWALMARGYDPNADHIKRGIEDFVQAVLAQQK